MRYRPFYLIFDNDSGETDVLGNPIRKQVKSDRYLGRFTEWSADDVAVYGREMTSATRKLISNGVAAEVAKNASEVELDGQSYEIESVKDLGRWTLMFVKGWRL